MKKLMTIIAFALSVSLSMSGQVRYNSQNQKNTRVKEQKEVQENEKPYQHGKTVSTVARETLSGPGKGDVVSTRAKIQGVSEKAERKREKEMKNKRGSSGQKKVKRDKTSIEKQTNKSATGNRKLAPAAKPVANAGLKQGFPMKK